MLNQLKLGVHFVREVTARDHEYDRVPEPDLVMENPDNVREYRDAGLANGNGSSVYLYNLLLLTPAIKPGSTVVDLACGPANLLVELAKLHPDSRFIGVDLSLEMLKWAKELKSAADIRNVDFIQADITDIQKLQPSAADLVMSTLSLHHLPSLETLRRCFGEMERILKPGGAIHLMDFASLKLESTAKYFAYERTRGLGEFLAMDYACSLRAAFRVKDFRNLLSIIQPKVPDARLMSTWGVPFLMAITSLGNGQPGPDQKERLADYWAQMRQSQRDDFEAMRVFFAMGGLKAPTPKRW